MKTKTTLSRDQREEMADRLEEIIYEMKEMIDEAEDIIGQAAPRLRDSATSQCLAHLKIALSRDHGYMDRYSDNLASYVDAVRGDDEETEEGEES